MLLDLRNKKGTLYVLNDYQSHLHCLLKKIYQREFLASKIQSSFSDPLSNKTMTSYVINLNEQLRGNLTIKHKDIDKLLDDFLEIKNHFKNHTEPIKDVNRININMDDAKVGNALDMIQKHLSLLKFNKNFAQNETEEKKYLMGIYDNIDLLKTSIKKDLNDTESVKYIKDQVQPSYTKNSLLNPVDSMNYIENVDNEEEKKWRGNNDSRRNDLYYFAQGNSVSKNLAGEVSNEIAPIQPNKANFFNLRPVKAALYAPPIIFSHDVLNIPDMNDDFLKAFAKYTRQPLYMRFSTLSTLSFEEMMVRYTKNFANISRAPYIPFDFDRYYKSKNNEQKPPALPLANHFLNIPDDQKYFNPYIQHFDDVHLDTIIIKSNFSHPTNIKPNVSPFSYLYPVTIPITLKPTLTNIETNSGNSLNLISLAMPITFPLTTYRENQIINGDSRRGSVNDGRILDPSINRTSQSVANKDYLQVQSPKDAALESPASYKLNPDESLESKNYIAGNKGEVFYPNRNITAELFKQFSENMILKINKTMLLERDYSPGSLNDPFRTIKPLNWHPINEWITTKPALSYPTEQGHVKRINKFVKIHLH
ncbi:unnamed protein product [Gordionus sp. m RMFG-2023]